MKHNAEMQEKIFAKNLLVFKILSPLSFIPQGRGTSGDAVYGRKNRVIVKNQPLQSMTCTVVGG